MMIRCSQEFARIVDVFKLGHARRQDGGKFRLRTVLDVGTVGIGHAVFAVVKDKFPEMIVEPPHGRLDHLVQGHEVHRGARGNSPPDQWLDVLDLDA